ncbi:hypothetical protein SAE02_76700 [Skermanella aerolata]|uniref:Thiamine biosynthesis protein ThiF n=1 Tax=Skermanella aerolata TaxID=393310 RepID=A0A512E4A4_9PROT|nr:ThiF family adenylyltransferase [Skermanella aerolata]KJB91311.1 hypothetical protein N826_31265 [Skermanella aerolata KACC 11604]GEO43522.1 hypothetical protein SAE02_76700 [Skermanella aerolata]
MSVSAWLEEFNETLDVSGFRHAPARSVVPYVQRYAAQAGAFVEGRRDGERELVILDLRTGAPQRPFYPIKPAERIGILFVREDVQPFVTMLRDDFPDTEHQLLVPEGVPATICIDDRPWGEARLTWTPAELIERILSWFHRAGRGELHDARQPIDPVMIGSHLSFYIARSVLNEADQDLIAFHRENDGRMLRVERAQPSRYPDNAEPFSVVTYRVPPGNMKRLKYAPDNLARLSAMLEERGIQLFHDLKQRLLAWVDQGEGATWRLHGRFAIIVEMPVVSPRGEQQDGIDHRAFVTGKTAGDIAVGLGVAQPSGGHGKVGYVRTIGAGAPDEAAIADIEIFCAEVNLAFEPDLAARLAGRGAPDGRAAVLIGAGAIGSHVADSLAREGRFRWTITDDDRLLPHNLARHVATGTRVMDPKAEVLAQHLNSINHVAHCARPIVANLFESSEKGEEIEKAVAEADIIIDATASVAAARYLSDHPAAARRASVFFNPAGEGAVLLAEPAGRTLTLRDLEAQYFGLVLRTEHLRDHLGRRAETVAYTGACRAITNRIPQSCASILSGLAALGLSAALDGEDAAITVWSLAPDGAVSVEAATPEAVTAFRAGDWQIAFDAGLIRRVHVMRDAKLPAETGGILLGLVDIPARRIHLVDATPAPHDSCEELSGFVRGIEGVSAIMDEVRLRTAGQIRYVGEWHSHPPHSSARPSAVDGVQIDWLAALLDMDTMPALMLIAGEGETAIIFADQKADALPQEPSVRGA